MQVCSVPGCSSRWNKFEAKVQFHVFPKDKESSQAWMKAIQVQVNVRSSNRPRICGKHFKEEDYFDVSMPACMLPNFKILRPSAVPSQNLPNTIQTPKDEPVFPPNLVLIPRDAEANVNGCLNHLQDPLDTSSESTNPNACSGSVDVTQQQISQLQKDAVIIENSSSPFGSSDFGVRVSQNICESWTQTDSEIQDAEEPKNCDAHTQTLFVSDLFLDVNDITDEQIMHLCGFTRSALKALFQFCMRNSPKIPIVAFKAENQLLLTLCKYKHNLDYLLLSILFRVERKVASSLFAFWTGLMYENFKSVDWWDLRVKKKNMYTVKLDCVEVPAEKSSKLELREKMMSLNEKRPTFKGLVGTDETGLVIYCSDLFHGSTSDTDMVVLSGFLDKVSSGDIVIADKGLAISDVLRSKKVRLSAPSHKRKRSQLDSETDKSENDCANANRKQRLASPGKAHRILLDVLPEHMWKMGPQIFYNSTMLCNFKRGLVFNIPT